MFKSQFLFFVFIFLLGSGCGRSPFSHKLNAANPSQNYELSSAQNRTTFNQSLLKDFEVDIYWLIPPHISGAAKAIMRVTRVDSSNRLELAALPFNPFFELWMPAPSMNHGSMPVQVTLLSPGVYLLEELWFFMKGDWVLRLYVESPEQSNLILHWSYDL